MGIPTDALYVLVADPLNLRAVARVFQAKGRETVRSLPLLISDIVMAEELAKDLSTRFYILARHFWPGPLTIIVPAAAKVPLKVTGNTGRLALRQVRSRLANAIVEKTGRPDLDQCEYFRAADLYKRDRSVRRDGRPDRSGSRWRRMCRPRRHNDRYHGTLLARHQGRRNFGKGNRRVPQGELASL